MQYTNLQNLCDHSFRMCYIKHVRFNYHELAEEPFRLRLGPFYG